MRKKKGFRGVITVCILLILVLAILFSGLQLLESTVLLEHLGLGQNTPTKTITRNGVEYFPRQDVTVMLILGIDQEGPVKSSN